jgi:hypothetical protein
MSNFKSGNQQGYRTRHLIPQDLLNTDRINAESLCCGKTTFDGGSLYFICVYFVYFNHATSRLLFT